MLISLLMLPGNGQNDVEIAAGSTVADLIELKGLSGRNIMVDGRAIPASQYSSTVLVSGQEVAAVGVSKGN